MNKKNKYERVRVKGRTVYLRNPSETTKAGHVFLVGTRVDKEGEALKWVKGKKLQTTIEIIELSCVTKRTEVFFNGRYGTLENEEWFPS